MHKLILVLFVSVFIFSNAKAQDDNVLWASMRLRILPDAKQAIAIRPIVRYNNNISSYQNSSVDLAYSYNASSRWTLGMISRTWFLKDGKNRQFLWPALTYKGTIGNFGFNNRFMYHHAFDIDDVPDADFFRMKASLSKPIGAKNKIQLFIEPWYRFNGINNLWRMRYELSISTKLNDHISAGILFRRQVDKGIAPDANHYVTTLTYQL